MQAVQSNTHTHAHTGVMSGAIVYLERDLNFSKIQSEIVVSALNLTSTIGALGGGQLAAKWGRRSTVALSASIFLFGALLMAITSSFFIILLSRVLLGLAAGIGLFLAPLYVKIYVYICVCFLDG